MVAIARLFPGPRISPTRPARRGRRSSSRTSPARDPADVLAALTILWPDVLDEPLRSQLPLREVGPTRAVAYDLPDGAVA